MSGASAGAAHAGRWILGTTDDPRAGDPLQVGGKGMQLARLAALAVRPGGVAFRVPRFVVVTAGAFARWAEAGHPIPAGEAEAEARRATIEAMAPPQELAGELAAALEAAALGRVLAVRSSAAAEDGASASFAGQFESVLGVDGTDPAAVWQAIARVWASAYGARALAYRARGAGAGAAAPIRMAVVVQEMVAPSVSGVAFSADPVSQRADVAVVSAVYGVGEGLVSGELNADTFRVAFLDGAASVIERGVAHKDRAVRLAAGGTRLEPVAEALRDRPALSDEEAARIARASRELADTLGAPQDVEWALEDSGTGHALVLLQTRPITTLAAPASRAPSAGATGERRVWDNSNIAESYGGVTTPLTFTFARAVYADVYRQFCRIMGVPEPLIATHREVFANMLGLVRGRVYCNLLNWYRTLALFPGFALNRGFMERMMGLREALADPPEPPNTGSRATDAWRVARVSSGMLREALRLKREVPAFHARVETTLAPVANQDLSAWREDDLVALYRRLEDELLRHWRAPLVNDFFAMIFFGTLCRLIERWLPGAPPTLANDLLCGEGGIISTEPARRVMRLARRVAGDPALVATFADTPDDRALFERLRSEPASAAFAAELADYIARFGDRCLEELKLETETLREDPTFLVQMIRAYAARGSADPDAAWQRELEIRRQAETRVLGALGGTRRMMFLWVLRNARARVRDRENLRFERTRVFGVVRRIVRSLGGHLARAGRLAAPSDVFYLAFDELMADVHGAGATTDLASLAALRKREFEGYARGPAPPDRFETFGPPAGWTVAAPDRAADAVRGATLSGIGCCPGVVRGRVRIVRDPREARGLDGHILVAERTDPGWTLLFPAASGLLVERGSLLSHSAIVAREMGLPCVVGIAGLLATLVEDEEVEMDGTLGTIRRLGIAS